MNLNFPLMLAILLLSQATLCSYRRRPKPTLVTPPGNFRSGFLHYSETNKNSSETFEQIPEGRMLLSICHLHYAHQFDLRVSRSLQNLPQRKMILWANISTMLRRKFQMTISYLVAEPLDYISYLTINLTSSHYRADFIISQKPDNKTVIGYFLLGFSSSFTSWFIDSKKTTTEEHIIFTIFSEIVLKSLAGDWIQITVVTMEKNNRCENGSLEYLMQIQNKEIGLIWNNSLAYYRENIFYIVGISNILSPKGFFNYSVQTHSVISTNITSLLYSVFGFNMVCNQFPLQVKENATSNSNVSVQQKTTIKNAFRVLLWPGQLIGLVLVTIVTLHQI